MLRRHLNFRQISHRFTWSFCKSHFSRFERLTYYVLKYDYFFNLSRFKVEPHSKYGFFALVLRPTFTTLLAKRRAFSHWMAVPKTSKQTNKQTNKQINKQTNKHKTKTKTNNNNKKKKKTYKQKKQKLREMQIGPPYRYNVVIHWACPASSGVCH